VGQEESWIDGKLYNLPIFDQIDYRKIPFKVTVVSDKISQDSDYAYFDFKEI
jgi:hypothetical protein